MFAENVDHGKTTLTQALTGKWADTHSEEKKRGITIRLGYAEATFYKCEKCKGAKAFGITDKCMCFSPAKKTRTISIIDAPGHETLMTTMLSGAALMDGAILLVAANEKCPQPQTREHLTALRIADIKNIVVVQNKIDVVSPEKAKENYKQIKEFLKGTRAENAPIIPVSAQKGINIDALIQAIEENIPSPKRDPSKPPKMLVARSFDINKPGTPIKNLGGGILGGGLVQGQLKVGQEIEIKPGIKVKDSYKTIKTKIIGLQQAGVNVETASPGGLLGVGTELDPSITKSDTLGGNVAGLPGKLPDVITILDFTTNLLGHVIGAKEHTKMDPLKPGEPLMLTVGITRTVGTVQSAAKGKARITLRIPICADKGERVAISRQVNGRWRLIGWGEVA